METVVKMAVLCVTGAVFAVLLKKTSPVMSLLLVTALCIAGLAWIVALADNIQTLWDRIDDAAGGNAQLFLPLLKILAIAIVCRLSAEVCRDAEYGAAAALVETAGAFGAVIVSIPLWEAVWELLQELM